MKIDFQLMPREPKHEQCWVYVGGVLVAKCATADKAAVLASYGYEPKRYGGFQGGAVKGR